ncbi:DUF4177 domain-containing protein [Calidithermus timidus]|jgi:hypothetical protein|uniref:DUF4177 domain-containing protein n=1 Tax=Calidithermus timidus TaxID=307124 RepID=UPI000364FFB6|nr:DUF4177 domain-containing protein [Calidithermus timidus]
MRYEYKAVQLPKHISVNARNRDSAAAELIQGVINNFAAEGWEFYRIDTVTTVEPPGCLAALFGQKDTYTPLNVVIFRRSL